MVGDWARMRGGAAVAAVSSCWRMDNVERFGRAGSASSTSGVVEAGTGQP